RLLLIPLRLQHIAGRPEEAQVEQTLPFTPAVATRTRIAEDRLVVGAGTGEVAKRLVRTRPLLKQLVPTRRPFPSRSRAIARNCFGGRGELFNRSWRRRKCMRLGRSLTRIAMGLRPVPSRSGMRCQISHMLCQVAGVGRLKCHKRLLMQIRTLSEQQAAGDCMAGEGM